MVLHGHAGIPGKSARGSKSSVSRAVIDDDDLLNA
jgi:hypothetical protein